ncbi:MAG: histidinol dehydrogenase [Acidimicrobiaceae bacterium]
MAFVLSRIDLRGVADLRGRLPRPPLAGDESEVVAAVRAILSDVRQRGDAAVRELTHRFDGVSVEDLAVPEAEVKRALEALAPELRAALEAAAANIAAFQRAEATPDVRWEQDGLVVRTLRRPVDRAGCYVPGGRATYPSTVLMTAVPARVAGVGEVVLCVPPGRDGRVPDVVLAAAGIAGVDTVYAIGGAQAVAAMAYGTESVAAVDVIVGPGNVYVAVAKREVAGEGRVGVPSAFAGPSEVVVVADGSVAAELAAIDVIVQAEHGPDGLAWLVTWSEVAADAIVAAVAELTANAPRRAEIEATLDANGRCVLVDGPEQAMAVANLIAPEHLELLVDDPESLVPLVRHAGAVFLGPWAPASLGDYAAGPSHVLPTHGSARFSGALTVDDFTKPVHVVDVDRAAFDRLAPHVVALAEAEGLAAHADSIRMRQP